MKVRLPLFLVISLMLLLYSSPPALSADKEETAPSEKTEIKDDATEQSQQSVYENRREYIKHMMEEHSKKKVGFSSRPDPKDQKDMNTPKTEEPATGEEPSLSEPGQE